MTSTQFRCRACGKEWRLNQLSAGVYGSLKYCADEKCAKLCDPIPTNEKGGDELCPSQETKSAPYALVESPEKAEPSAQFTGSNAGGDVQTIASPQPAEQETPETDAAVNDTALENKNEPHTDWVTADFARQLERELLAAQAELAEAAKEMDEANEKLAYVHSMGLRFGMMKTSDKPEPYLAHTWTEDSDHERMFREWSASIGITSDLSAAHAQIARLTKGIEFILSKVREWRVTGPIQLPEGFPLEQALEELLTATGKDGQ